MQKIFNTPILESQSLHQVTNRSSRHYEKVSGEKYYSVTTMLSKTKDQQGLKAWRTRIGEEEANKITTQAASLGTKLHLLSEKFLANENIDSFFEFDLLLKQRFNPIKDFLEFEVDTLLASEILLYSDVLKLAGCCDLIFKNNKNQLILGDFKTAKKPKKLEYIKDYILQLCCYAIMVHERFGLLIDQGLLIFSYENNKLETFYFDLPNHFDDLFDRIKTFHQLLNKGN